MVFTFLNKRVSALLLLPSNNYPPPSADNDPQLARTELAELGQAQSARAVHKATQENHRAREGVVAGGGHTTRSDALVEAVNGLLEQAKRAARGFRRPVTSSPTCVCPRQHLPAHPFA